jgi:hypothetical protein
VPGIAAADPEYGLDTGGGATGGGATGLATMVVSDTAAPGAAFEYVDALSTT